MSEGEHTNEVVEKYPKLFRARELFIKLFVDSRPLVNLGYTSQQVEYAKPCLALIQEEGSVRTHLKSPYLNFENPNDEEKLVDISLLPNHDGYRMIALRDYFKLIPHYRDPRERLLAALEAEAPVVIFPDCGIDVAKITLLTDSEKVGDLNFLALTLLREDLAENRERLREEKPITKVLHKIGKTSTYKAAWVDEGTKLEFVARLDEPGYDPIFVSYRRLYGLSDDQGTVIPVGKKANISGEKVTKILTERKPQAIGKLAFEPSHT